jgi:hypothetical protein
MGFHTGTRQGTTKVCRIALPEVDAEHFCTVAQVHQPAFDSSRVTIQLIMIPEINDCV